MQSRGVTLIEVMIVVLILGLIAGAVALAVIPQGMKAKITMTAVNANNIRHAAETWRFQHGGDTCPTVARLKEDKLLDRAKSLDAWNAPFKIVCEAEDLYVRSNGPDGKEGSEDDIVGPEKEKASTAATESRHASL